MDQETKVKCYQSIYAALKNEYGISELGYPEKKDALVFHCKIADDISFTYSLRMEMDLLMLRVEQDCPEVENSDLVQRAQHVSLNFDGMMGTSYDRKIILMLSVPFAGVTDDLASKLIYDKTLEFVRYVRKELGGLEPPAEEEKKEVEENVKKILFFQNSSTEEKADEESKIDEQLEEAQEYPKEETEPLKEHDIKPILFDEYPWNFDDGSQDHPITSASSGEEVVFNDESEEKTDVEVGDLPEEETDIKPESNLAESENPDKHESADGSQEALALLDETKKSRIGSDTVNKVMENSLEYKAEQLNFREGLLEKKKLLLDQREKKMQEERSALDSEKDDAFEAVRKKQADLEEKEKGLIKQEEQLKKEQEAFTAQKQNLHRKEQSVTDREKNLNKKITEIEEKEKELNRIQASVTERVEYADKIKLEYYEKEQELIQKEQELEKREQEAFEQEQRAMLLNESNFMERNALDAEKKDMEEMKRILDELSETSKGEQNSEQLKNELQKAQEELKITQEELKTAHDELREMQEKVKILVQEKEDLEQEKKTLIQEKEGLEKENTFIQEELSAESIKKEMEEAGYRMEIVAGEGDPLLACEIDGCKIYIHAKAKILCVEKKVHKKYYRKLEEWNQEEITESYSQALGKVICRKNFNNPVNDLRKPVMRLKDLR